MFILKFLFIFLLIFLFLVLLLGRSFFKIISTLLFGSRTKSGARRSNQSRPSQAQQQEKSTSPDKKVVAPDEGEYIDFEEIKDQNNN